MKKQIQKYEDKVLAFSECLMETGSRRSAAILAHKEHGLNAADSEGGISSDQAAFEEACSGFDFD